MGTRLRQSSKPGSDPPRSGWSDPAARSCRKASCAHAPKHIGPARGRARLSFESRRILHKNAEKSTRRLGQTLYSGFRRPRARPEFSAAWYRIGHCSDAPHPPRVQGTGEVAGSARNDQGQRKQRQVGNATMKDRRPERNPDGGPGDRMLRRLPGDLVPQIAGFVACRLSGLPRLPTIRSVWEANAIYQGR